MHRHILCIENLCPDQTLGQKCTILEHYKKLLKFIFRYLLAPSRNSRSESVRNKYLVATFLVHYWSKKITQNFMLKNDAPKI